MKLQEYNSDNAEKIKQLFTGVFTDSEGQSEGILIGDLVDKLMRETDEQDLYGFVAIDHEKIIGCIFFSRLTFECNVNAFMLAPVAIHTSFQGKGNGQKLINYGVSSLKDKGVELVITYGDPRFYSKVGFQTLSVNVIQPPLALSMPIGWLGQSLTGNPIPTIKERPRCVKAFNDPVYW